LHFRRLTLFANESRCRFVKLRSLMLPDMCQTIRKLTLLWRALVPLNQVKLRYTSVWHFSYTQPSQSGFHLQLIQARRNAMQAQLQLILAQKSGSKCRLRASFCGHLAARTTELSHCPGSVAPLLTQRPVPAAQAMARHTCWPCVHWIP
jgi:hypothetical protein